MPPENCLSSQLLAIVCLWSRTREKTLSKPCHKVKMSHPPRLGIYRAAFSCQESFCGSSPRGALPSVEGLGCVSEGRSVRDHSLYQENNYTLITLHCRVWFSQVCVCVWCACEHAPEWDHTHWGVISGPQAPIGLSWLSYIPGFRWGYSLKRDKPYNSSMETLKEKPYWRDQKS